MKHGVDAWMFVERGACTVEGIASKEGISVGSWTGMYVCFFAFGRWY